MTTRFMNLLSQIRSFFRPKLVTAPVIMHGLTYQQQLEFDGAMTMLKGRIASADTILARECPVDLVAREGIRRVDAALIGVRQELGAHEMQISSNRAMAHMHVRKRKPRTAPKKKAPAKKK